MVLLLVTAGRGKMKHTKRMFITALGLLWAVLSLGGCGGVNELLIDNMEDGSEWKIPSKKKGMLKISTDNEAKMGNKALLINIMTEKTSATAYRYIKPGPDWNAYDGISFWAKGNGSEDHASIMLQAGNWGKAWVATFSLAEKAWHEVKFAWGDFVPVSPLIPELGSEKGCLPSDFDEIMFGKRNGLNIFHKCPPFSFSIDEVKLVKGIKHNRPRLKLSEFSPLSSVIEKLRTGKRVTILALGDSITHGNSAGGNKGAYPALLGKMLSDYYGNPDIRIVNRSIGGSTTYEGRQWIKRDVCGVEADLVTVMFGGNEKPQPGEIQKHTKAFIRNMISYLEETGGTMKTPPACMVLTTIPGRKEHWNTLDPYAEAIRDLEKIYPDLTIADLNRHFKEKGIEAYAAFMSDEAHPNSSGHKEMAKFLFRLITGRGFKGNGSKTE